MLIYGSTSNYSLRYYKFGSDFDETSVEKYTADLIDSKIHERELDIQQLCYDLYSTPSLLHDGAAILNQNIEAQITDVKKLAFTAITGLNFSITAPTLQNPSLVSGGSLTLGTTYYYRCTALDSYGETAGSNEKSMITTTGNLSVQHKWTTPSNAISFRVYRGTSSLGQDRYYAITTSYISAPTGPTTSVGGTGGTLPIGTYYYIVTALDTYTESIGSTEVTATITNVGQKPTISWNAVTGATKYRIYRGTISGGENKYYEETAPTVSHTDDGTGGTTGSVPTNCTTTFIDTGATPTATGVTAPTYALGILSGKTAVKVDSASGFTSGGNFIITDGTNTETKIIDSIVGLVINLTTALSNNYVKRNTLIAAKSSTWTDNTTSKYVYPTDTAYRLGLGTTTPGGVLDIQGSLSASGDQFAFKLSSSITSSSADAYGLSIAPTLAPPNTKSAYIAYVSPTINAPTGGAVNSYGLYITNPTKTGTGTISNVYGIYIKTPTVGSVENYAVFGGGGKTQLGGTVIIASNLINITTAKTPASSGDTGTTGNICWDTNYIYVCVSTNTWKRAALSTF